MDNRTNLTEFTVRRADGSIIRGGMDTDYLNTILRNYAGQELIITGARYLGSGNGWEDREVMVSGAVIHDVCEFCDDCNEPVLVCVCDPVVLNPNLDAELAAYQAETDRRNAEARISTTIYGWFAVHYPPSLPTSQRGLIHSTWARWEDAERTAAELTESISREAALAAGECWACGNMLSFCICEPNGLPSFTETTALHTSWSQAWWAAQDAAITAWDDVTPEMTAGWKMAADMTRLAAQLQVIVFDAECQPGTQSTPLALPEWATLGTMYCTDCGAPLTEEHDGTVGLYFRNGCAWTSGQGPTCPSHTKLRLFWAAPAGVDPLVTSERLNDEIMTIATLDRGPARIKMACDAVILTNRCRTGQPMLALPVSIEAGFWCAECGDPITEYLPACDPFPATFNQKMGAGWGHAWNAPLCATHGKLAAFWTRAAGEDPGLAWPEVLDPQISALRSAGLAAFARYQAAWDLDGAHNATRAQEMATYQAVLRRLSALATLRTEAIERLEEDAHDVHLDASQARHDAWLDAIYG